MLFADVYCLINRVNIWSNNARLSNIVIIELLTGYISPFWLTNYVMLL